MSTHPTPVIPVLDTGTPATPVIPVLDTGPPCPLIPESTAPAGNACNSR